MEVRVFWTENARSDLKEIFGFYKEVAGVNIARKLVLRIIERTIQLEN
jgi:plasmid stabilization system protein ParE